MEAVFTTFTTFYYFFTFIQGNFYKRDFYELVLDIKFHESINSQLFYKKKKI